MVFASEDERKLQDVLLLVDEIDMAAPSKDDGFKGAHGFIRAKFFYGMTAVPLNQAELDSFYEELQSPQAPSAANGTKEEHLNMPQAPSV